MVAARAAGARILDPRGFAVGTIAEAYAKYPHTAAVLPTLGYSGTQRAELEETPRRNGCDRRHEPGAPRSRRARERPDSACSV
jgi:predicted GTPase